MKIRKSDVGRWVTVKWYDVGRVDCLLVDVDVDSKTGEVFQPYDGLHTIEINQIVDVRKHIDAA